MENQASPNANAALTWSVHPHGQCAGGACNLSNRLLAKLEEFVRAWPCFGFHEVARARPHIHTFTHFNQWILKNVCRLPWQSLYNKKVNVMWLITWMYIIYLLLKFNCHFGSVFDLYYRINRGFHSTHWFPFFKRRYLTAIRWDTLAYRIGYPSIQSSMLDHFLRKILGRFC